VDARLGPVPGEYCPGDYSINDGHGHKLVGTAQRLVRGAWLFSTVIVVTDAEPVRDVLVAAYRALRLDWDPRTVGAVADTVPGVRVQDTRNAVLAAYTALTELTSDGVEPLVLAKARERHDRHLLPTVDPQRPSGTT